MDKPRDIRSYSPEETIKFFESFDTVMSDCDGVLWYIDKPIEGALDALKSLQDLGKRVLFVSNNSTLRPEDYLPKLKKLGFEATLDQIILPSLVILWYLRKINFQGKALVIGTTAFRKVLEEGGITITTVPNTVVESIDAIRDLLHIDPDVRAVILDFDINLNWAKILKASLYLERENVIFISGVLDRYLPMSAEQSILGMGQFVDILIEKTGKKPIECAKPSTILANYLVEHCQIDDSKKCIFIGDSLASDIKFAELCGFAKLWVGSGVDQIDSHRNQKVSTIADYYLPDLGCLNQLIEKCSLNAQQDQPE